MKVIARFLCSLTLLTLFVAPVQAQPDIGDTAGDVLEVATESAQSLGVAATVAIIVSVIVLVIVVGGAVGLVLFAYKGGFRPVYDLVIQANNRADEEREAREASEKRVTEYRERQAEAAKVQADAVERQAAASERLAERMAKIETAEQANQGRKTAVETIQKSVTDAVEPVANNVQAMRDQLDEAVTTLKDATERISSFASKQDLENELRPITDELKAVTLRLSSLELRIKPDQAAGADTPPEA